MSLVLTITLLSEFLQKSRPIRFYRFLDVTTTCYEKFTNDFVKKSELCLLFVLQQSQKKSEKCVINENGLRGLVKMCTHLEHNTGGGQTSLQKHIF